jgi:alkanesulfonate monooxygenase SsuD/methylene tetrahydromethanopterin reductase-like flavin-dependent oxidoreductase (luciferase family)
MPEKRQPTTSAAPVLVEYGGSCNRHTDQSIVGPPDHWVEVLTHFALDLEFGTFVLVAPPDLDTLTTFIEDVAPTVRERVGERRATQEGPDA